MTSLSLLGSTGSIGVQTLEVVRAEPEAWDVVALGAGRSVDRLVDQAREFHPRLVVVGDTDLMPEVREELPGIAVAAGPSALAEAATMGQVVVNGVVGFAGLPVTLTALESGCRLALANKESLIAAGPVVRRARQTPGAELLPVDSEHCAVHQCLRANDVFTARAGDGVEGMAGDEVNVSEGMAGMERVNRVLLTASGGPFRGRTRAELADVSVQQALAHPTWSMGPKITVDSSTLMNKGLEVIEANELFGLGYDRIEVVIHPQSVVHSMVEYTDGATIAQLSLPDMRLCIGYALAYPDRISMPFGRINWAELRRLDFEPPDTATFPCLSLAYTAGRMGETAPAALNAANEVAVQAFLEERIRWTAIPEILETVLDGHDGTEADSLEAVMEIDGKARAAAEQAVRLHTRAR